MVIGLGGLNLFGVIILGTMLKYDYACILFCFDNDMFSTFSLIFYLDFNLKGI